MPQPSGKTVFWINFSIALVLLTIATGILGYFFMSDDPNAIDWRKFSAYTLFAGWWTFFMFGVWIGILNMRCENENSNLTSQNRSLKAKSS
jgi:uncharacterized membrane protein